MTGTQRIAKERERQIEVEGFVHDDKYLNHELMHAAYAYEYNCQKCWPWDLKWWKPTPNDQVRQLVKAGALYEAEKMRSILSVKDSETDILKIRMTTDHIDDMAACSFRCAVKINLLQEVPVKTLKEI